MKRVLAVMALSVWLVFPAAGAGLDATAINNAPYRAKLADDRVDAAVVKLQVLLDRAQFFPGEIDGKFWRKCRKGSERFRRTSGRDR